MLPDQIKIEDFKLQIAFKLNSSNLGVVKAEHSNPKDSFVRRTVYLPKFFGLAAYE